MATAPLGPSSTRNLAKPILWATLALIALSVLVTVEFPLFGSPSSTRDRFFFERFILIPHALAGLTAFLIGPFQFSTRLRQRNLRRHRILGKVYVIAILIAVPCALILASGVPQPLKLASNTQATLWFLCTAAAFLTARNRQITQHRIWMVRSYASTCIFFTSRILIPIPAYGNLGPTGIACALFLLQLSAFVIPDIAFHWQALTTRRK
jgi:uncharacterized membrane protein